MLINLFPGSSIQFTTQYIPPGSDSNTLFTYTHNIHNFSTGTATDRLFHHNSAQSLPQSDSDCVEYSLYPTADGLGNLQLPELNTLISAFVAKWTDDYIWQKDRFALSVVTGPG